MQELQRTKTRFLAGIARWDWRGYASNCARYNREWPWKQWPGFCMEYIYNGNICSERRYTFGRERDTKSHKVLGSLSIIQSRFHVLHSNFGLVILQWGQKRQGNRDRGHLPSWKVVKFLRTNYHCNWAADNIIQLGDWLQTVILLHLSFALNHKHTQFLGWHLTSCEHYILNPLIKSMVLKKNLRINSFQIVNQNQAVLPFVTWVVQRKS